MGAFAVEAGTTLGEVYRRLFLGWGVVLPAGQSPDIGIGGHALGSAFGFLHRRHGLAGDYLYAVEVVFVDGSGTAKSVIATRKPSDPNRELWWAHTGGGGGNFGVVTRYWFRADDADGSDPTRALPRLGFRHDAQGRVGVERPGRARVQRSSGTTARGVSGTANSRYAELFSVITAACRHLQGKIELR